MILRARQVASQKSVRGEDYPLLLESRVQYSVWNFICALGGTFDFFPNDDDDEARRAHVFISPDEIAIFRRPHVSPAHATATTWTTTTSTAGDDGLQRVAALSPQSIPRIRGEGERVRHFPRIHFPAHPLKMNPSYDGITTSFLPLADVQFRG